MHRLILIRICFTFWTASYHSIVMIIIFIVFNWSCTKTLLEIIKASSFDWIKIVSSRWMIFLNNLNKQSGSNSQGNSKDIYFTHDQWRGSHSGRSVCCPISIPNRIYIPILIWKDWEILDSIDHEAHLLHELCLFCVSHLTICDKRISP